MRQKNILISLLVVLVGIVIVVVVITKKNIPSDAGTVVVSDTTVPVLLFYPNTKTSAYTADPCDAKSLSFIVRRISDTETVKKSIEELLKGGLTSDEKTAGFTTEFPNAGFKLVSAVQVGGQLTLTFQDSNFFTSGGSCRVGILRAEIEKTAMQFEGITSVKILPEELFQP